MKDFYCPSCRKYKPVEKRVKQVRGRGGKITVYKCSDCVKGETATPEERAEHGRKASEMNKAETRAHYSRLRGTSLDQKKKRFANE